MSEKKWKWIAVDAGAPMFTAKDLAAAEERGRRAGIEERDELRAALRIADAVLMEAQLYRGTPTGLTKSCETARRQIEVALAPRDSGKEGA